MPAPTEFEIQRALCLWLDGYPDRKGVPTKPPALRPDCEYWHTPNGGQRSAAEGARFKQIGVKPGVHDLLFLCCGMLFGLEMKDDRGELSKAQIKMHKRLLSVGLAVSATVDSLAAAKAQLRAWNLIVPGC